METILPLLQILLPAAIVGTTAFLIVRQYLNYEAGRQKLEIEKARQEIIFPARMQAYERVILFLERSTPESLIRRVLKSSMSARLFQSDLISVIRNEFDHNLSQQVYISAKSWHMVKTSTEETVRMINVAASKVSATATATELAEALLHISAQIGKLPTHVAIEAVKKEFSLYFMGYTSSQNS